ncbi:hypothetical protein BO71DRAFT_431003 [Aspergillus ellipticus CBS 707.79]|uniref:Uncharacterized protein n=1 Tax=Aspergillus ellipticus CBS 707.79 TaxID=1448320 RepID=A0A319D7C5_9EURO|nr:hypothetical protein BO71DRAFT_431003 [Aspergillus ellipticus CBS 707.79]
MVSISKSGLVFCLVLIFTGFPTATANSFVRSFVRCDGEEFTKEDIFNALEQAKVAQEEKYQGSNIRYPTGHCNREKFFHIRDNLYAEYPLMRGSVYTGGLPDRFRVIMDEGYNDVESVYHPKNDRRIFLKCTDMPFMRRIDSNYVMSTNAEFSSERNYLTGAYDRPNTNERPNADCKFNINGKARSHVRCNCTLCPGISVRQPGFALVVTFVSVVTDTSAVAGISVIADAVFPSLDIVFILAMAAGVAVGVRLAIRASIVNLIRGKRQPTHSLL